MNRRGGSSGASGGNPRGLAEKWEREAFDYDKQSNAANDLTLVERRLLQMHARVKRGCAQELKLELAKG